MQTVGFSNLTGTLCYANSAVQILKFHLDIPYCQYPSSLINELQRLKFYTRNYQRLDVVGVLSQLNIKTDHCGDSIDLICTILDVIKIENEEIASTITPQNYKIASVCDWCGKTERRADPPGLFFYNIGKKKVNDILKEFKFQESRCETCGGNKKKTVSFNGDKFFMFFPEGIKDESQLEGIKGKIVGFIISCNAHAQSFVKVKGTWYLFNDDACYQYTKSFPSIPRGYEITSILFGGYSFFKEPESLVPRFPQCLTRLLSCCGSGEDLLEINNSNASSSEFICTHTIQCNFLSENYSKNLKVF